MPERILRPESPEISRDEAIAAYKKFVEKGVANPDDLDLRDPDVIEANNLFDKWREQEGGKAAGNKEAERRLNLAKTMFYIDAGFTDPAYLEEVLGWLDQDLENVEGDESLGDIADDIKKTTTKIKQRLSKDSS